MPSDGASVSLTARLVGGEDTAPLSSADDVDRNGRQSLGRTRRRRPLRLLGHRLHGARKPRRGIRRQAVPGVRRRGGAVAAGDGPVDRACGPGGLRRRDDAVPVYALREKTQRVAGTFEAYRAAMVADVEARGANLEVTLETALGEESVTAFPACQTARTSRSTRSRRAESGSH